MALTLPTIAWPPSATWTCWTVIFCSPFERYSFNADICAAKLRGVYKGRPASIDAAKVAALKAEGLGASEIAKRLKVGRASVYRVLAERRPPSAPAPDALTQALSQNARFKVLAASYGARPSERKRVALARASKDTLRF